MEPADLIPTKSSPPPLKGHEAGPTEAEPRGFEQVSLGVSGRPPGLTDSPDSPSSLGQPSPLVRSDTHRPGRDSHLPVERSQPPLPTNPGSGWNGRDAEHQDLKAESCVRLTDDHRGADTGLPEAEVGFADLAVFTEQTGHHWCCGFTPSSGNPGNLASGLEQSNSSNGGAGPAYSPGQGVSGDSELSPDSPKAEEKGRAIIRRRQEEDAAAAQPSQDQQQPQETAATLVLPFGKPYFETEPVQNDLTCRGNRCKTFEVPEDGDGQSAGGEEPGNGGTVKGAPPKRQEDRQDLASPETQENSATSSPLQDAARAQTADDAVLILGTLPPSDSFADFCAAPVRADGEDLWAEFTDLKELGGETAWTGRSSRQVSLSCRVQELFLGSFLEAEGPSPGLEQEVLSLAALLDAQHPPQSEEEEEERGWWRLPRDLHSAVGLRFQWGGSHSSRTLLRCLGVAAKTTCLLETPKDSASAACAPKHTAGAAPAPSMQEPIPSTQVDWNSRRLSSSQDGACLCRAPHFWGRK